MLTQDDVIYFVLTDRFRDGDHGNNTDNRRGLAADRNNPGGYHGGDFPGLIEKLPYLQQLGVTAVWITPVYLSIGRLDRSSAEGYHGYWALDFDKVDPLLHAAGPHPAGSKAYLADLTRALHERQMKLVLDVVVNHTGYHNQTYREYPEALKLPARFFNREGAGEFDSELSGLPDLDHDQADVVFHFVNNLLDWIGETGIDAIRMDTAKHVEDRFWYFYKAQVKGPHPGVTLLGEVLNFDVAHVARYQTEHDFDSLFDFPLRGAAIDCFIHDASLRRLARPRLAGGETPGILDEDNPAKGGYTNANRLVTLLDNHDLDRRIMSEGRMRMPGPDRRPALKLVELCLSFLFTTRGIPKLYYGTELGMEGWKDGGDDSRMRLDFPWQLIGADQRPNAGSDERRLYDHTRRLIEIRRQHPALCYGALLTVYVDQFVYAYLRVHRDDVVLTVINNGHADMPSALPLQIGSNSNIPGSAKQAFEGHPLVDLLDPGFRTQMQDGRLPVQVPGKRARVLAVAR
jgi:alpha-amylase